MAKYVCCSPYVLIQRYEYMLYSLFIITILLIVFRINCISSININFIPYLLYKPYRYMLIPYLL
jgi:hypothetical protein